MFIDISKIKVTERIRKDFGNIKELADDIKENGLINPPVVTPDFELIAGERRLRAMKHLGYKQIEVRIMKVNDYEHMLNLEINENENRKDFTKLERLEYARRLERIERLKAEERKKSTQFGSDVQNFAPPCDEGKTRDIVAEKLGLGSGEQYRKEKYIAENADEKTLTEWDRGDISTHKAYTQIKQLEKKVEQLEDKNKELEGELENRPVVEKEKIVETEVYPDDYHQMQNDLEFLKHQLQEKSKEETKEFKGNSDSFIDEFQSKFQFKLDTFITALSDCSILINPFIFMDNYYKKMGQEHIEYLLKEVSKLENDIKGLKNQIKYQGGIVNE